MSAQMTLRLPHCRDEECVARRLHDSKVAVKTSSCEYRLCGRAVPHPDDMLQYAASLTRLCANYRFVLGTESIPATCTASNSPASSAHIANGPAKLPHLL